MLLQLPGKTPNYPEYILKLSGATDLFHEYVQQIERKFNIFGADAEKLVFYYRADKLLNSDNIIILKNIKADILKIIHVKNIDEAVGCIANIEQDEYQVLYVAIEGMQQIVWCKHIDNTLEFYLAEKTNVD